MRARCSGGWAGAWRDATSLPAPGPTHQQPSDFLGDNGTGWGCQTQCLPENLKPDLRPLPWKGVTCPSPEGSPTDDKEGGFAKPEDVLTQFHPSPQNKLNSPQNGPNRCLRARRSPKHAEVWTPWGPRRGGNRPPRKPRHCLSGRSRDRSLEKRPHGEPRPVSPRRGDSGLGTAHSPGPRPGPAGQRPGPRTAPPPQDTKDIVPGPEHVPPPQPCHDRPRSPQSRPAADTAEPTDPMWAPAARYAGACQPHPESRASLRMSARRRPHG